MIIPKSTKQTNRLEPQELSTSGRAPDWGSGRSRETERESMLGAENLGHRYGASVGEPLATVLLLSRPRGRQDVALEPPAGGGRLAGTKLPPSICPLPRGS